VDPISEFRNLKFWDRFGIWGGLASTVSLILGLVGLTLTVAGLLLSAYALVPTSEIAVDKSLPADKQTITGKTGGPNSPIIISQGPVSYTNSTDSPNEYTPVYFLNAGDPPSQIDLFKEPVYSLMDSASNRLAELKPGTIVAVIDKRLEILNVDDIEDRLLNGLRVVKWKKVRLTNNGDASLYGWVVSRFVDVR